MRLSQRLRLLEQLVVGGASEAVALADEGDLGGGFTEPAGQEVTLSKSGGRIYLDGRLSHAAGLVEAFEALTLPETHLPEKDTWVPIIIWDTDANEDLNGSLFIDSETGSAVLQGIGNDPIGAVLLVLDGVNFKAA